MKCKVCGANNEDYLEYCENCAAPLTGSAEAADDMGSVPREQRSWGFVASPDWSKPDFSANTVSEKDIPQDFQPQSNRPRYNSVQQTAPGESAKRNSVRASVKVAASTFCPHCGAPVQAGQRYCNDCGQRVDEPAAPVSVAPAAPVAAAAASFSAEGGAAASQSIKYADPIEDDMFSFNYDDEEEEERPHKRKKPAPAPVPARSRSGASRSRKRGGLALDKSLLFWIAAAVLVVALAVMGIVLATRSGGLGGFFGGIFSSSSKEPTVTKTTTENGDPAYNITVNAKKGSTVHFEGGAIVHDTPVTKSKPVTLIVPEAVWVPSEPVEGDKLEIYPNITIIAKDGTETPLTFAAPIVIDIPTLSLSVTSPNTPAFDTNTADVAISGVVGDPTSAVFVNDMQLTVDESGNFTGTYSLAAEGESTINVEARKNGYAIARQAFTVNYSTTTPATTTPATTTPATTPTGGDAIGGTGGGSAAAPGTLPAGATAVAYAATADLNVRSQPNTSSQDTVIGKLSLNQKVYVVEKDAGNSWAKVLYNGSEAYVSNVLITVIENYAVKNATVITDGLNGRATASSSSESLAKFALNAKVNYIKDVGNGWSMIESDGKILYAATNYLKVG